MNFQIDTEKGKLTTIFANWDSNPSFLIEILQDIQEEYHFLPRPALEFTSENLSIPLSRIFHIATFFKGLSIVPRGKHLIQVCMGTACHVQGSPKILEAFERELKVKSGHTSEDFKYSLEAVRCLGCCGLAAVVTVDKDLYGQVKLTRASSIVKKYN
jgi:NADH-quinone oxidoreductase subunit E